MELQFNKSVCQCLSRIAREVSAQELTQEVRLTEGMPDIGRVLSAWGQMVLRSKEWRGDTVTLSGGVMVWVLYAPEDGSEPRCMDAWIPYQLRWEHLDSSREGPVRISPLLRFVDARTVAARKFMVRAGAAAMAEMLCPSEIQMYHASELPDDIEVLRRTYPVRLPKEAGEKTFLIDEELSIPGNDPEKILSYTVRTEITDRRVLANKVVFRGNAVLHLVYRCGEGRIRIHDFEVPFSQYGDLEFSHSPDAQPDIWMGTTSLELDLGDQGHMRLKCGLVAQYLVDDRELIELIEDAYSPNRLIKVKTQLLELPSILESREDTVLAEQQLTGHSGEVADINFMPDFPRQQRLGEQVRLELPGMFQILYYSGDGSLQSANIRWEGELILPAGDDSHLDTHLYSAGHSMASSSADGFTLNGQLQLRTDTGSGCGLLMVTGLEVGEARDPDPQRPSLILCRPGSESLWDLAKRCGSTVEAIRNANDIDDDVASDKILLIPVS